MPAFFSIIIPTLNSAESIKKCLNSILEQSFQNFEIIIIDGNSMDSTCNIAKSAMDKRIVIHSSPDLGIYDAMNKGIKLAKGDWLYFLGSDDFFFKESVLFNTWSVISRTNKPVVYGNVLIKGNPGWAKDGEIYAGLFSKNRMLVKAICHQSIFYKKDFIVGNSILFDPRFYVSADWHFNLSCRRLTKFKYVDIIVAVFQAGGISSFKSDSFRDHINAEFIDLIPSKFETKVKEFLKRIINYAKEDF